MGGIKRAAPFGFSIITQPSTEFVRRVTGSPLAAPEGKPEVSVGPVSVALKGPVYVGLAVCSHDASVSETAVFSAVAVKSD